MLFNYYCSLKKNVAVKKKEKRKKYLSQKKTKPLKVISHLYFTRTFYL